MSKPTRNTKSKNRGKMQGEDTMDCSRISSSSISSSDSEAGLITNDEDREGMPISNMELYFNMKYRELDVHL